MTKIRNSLAARLIAAMLAGLLFGVLVSEVSYSFSNHTTRPPQQVDVVIPAGTAAKLSSGQVVQNIPATMQFVEGDTLVVKNQDSVSHTLGPVWVPPGASGVLNLQTASEYSYSCSFESSNTLGINVQPALTIWLRLQGYLNVGLPTGIMLAVYSFALVDKKKEEV
jgi:hypothetical protein